VSQPYGQFPEEVAGLLHAALDQLSEIERPLKNANEPEVLLAMQTVDLLFDSAMVVDRKAFPSGWIEHINDARFYLNAVGINAELVDIAERKLRKALDELTGYWVA
jgi:hypothetical protein